MKNNVRQSVMRSWSSINNEYSLTLDSRRSDTIKSNDRFILKADVQYQRDYNNECKDQSLQTANCFKQELAWLYCNVNG